MTVRRAGYIAFIISISALVSQPPAAPRIPAFSTAFYRMQTDIRDNVISPDSARSAFAAVVMQLRAAYPRDTCAPIDSAYFVYPLRGYYPRESIGGRGRGYRPKGFDLFDMNASGSHPAHDLFIKDGNQDNLDDRTWKPVDVLAFTSGVVVATETGWRYDSEYRGGNWIWIYDPCLDGFFYYAHNNIVQVQPGQWVHAGEKIAEVGRSGYNAYKERSPTHVHLMYLQLDQAGMPEPYNTYEWMKQSQTVEVFDAE
ncbi:M23 family metallopeptidase [Dyadobacter sandarakinus]|uniref:M23 family metallopeptidase n=2 Tax=Dyadobacter sandarakinus TaxID=2747268 RepID=A0ABX7IDK2_9BACT|nr:M23 family metallopeptidase [Dyadobacter sandarakinus]